MLFSYFFPKLTLKRYVPQTRRVYLANTIQSYAGVTPCLHTLLTSSWLSPPSPSFQHSRIFQHNFHLLTHGLFLFGSNILTTLKDFQANQGQHQLLPCIMQTLLTIQPTFSLILVKPHLPCFSTCPFPWHCNFLLLFSSSGMHFLWILPYLRLSMPNPNYQSMSGLKTVSFLKLFTSALSLNESFLF